MRRPFGRINYRLIYGDLGGKEKRRSKVRQQQDARSGSRALYRCLFVFAVFTSIATWKGISFLMEGENPVALELSKARRAQVYRDNQTSAEGNGMTPRRLQGNGQLGVPDEYGYVLEEGYDCLDWDEQYDKKNIKLAMVRTYHVTMGGPDGDKCNSGEGPCLRNEKLYTLVYYIPGMFYMFVALAIVCDEFFVPSLESFVEHFGISMDVAGATFMAAGGSMPELFTSFISVFDESAVGFAAIVGSAVFNVLFVIAVCALASETDLQLTGWPLGRDVGFYMVSLAMCYIFITGITPKQIDIWEAFLLFCWYLCYCSFMVVNQKAHDFVMKMRGKDVPLQDGEESERRNSEVNFKAPSAFRVGIVQLLTQHSSIAETAGIAAVTELKGSLKEAFEELDEDHDGGIDEAEFKHFLDRLGWHPNEDEQALKKAWRCLAKNEDGKVGFEEFKKWYMVSEARVEIEVRRIFDQFDRDGNGKIDKEEISKLLGALGHKTGESDIEDVLREIHECCNGNGDTDGTKSEQNGKSEKGDEKANVVVQDPKDEEGTQRTEYITFEEFDKWYGQSIFRNSHQRKHAIEMEEDEGFKIDWPEDPTPFQLFWYFFTYPLTSAMYCSLPDVRRPGMEGKVRWAVVEFAASLIWMGAFSNALYECVVVCSNTLFIPPQVSAVTIVAGGTSIPDLLSSYIVAKQGEGDMAVSSSIGSNIFDVTVGLPVPWMIYSLYKGGEPIPVLAKGINISILVLIVMIGLVIGTVVFMDWKMTKSLGWAMIGFYFLFLVQDLIRQLPANDPLVVLPDGW